MTKIKKLLSNRRGENYVDISVIVIVVVMCLALIFAVTPALIKKSTLDYFAKELAREAKISGEVGYSVSARMVKLKNETGLNPTVSWSRTGKIQLNSEFAVTLTLTTDLGFGGFASLPVTLTAKASGKSEVYRK